MDRTFGAAALPASRVGSSNTITADPPVSRPRTTPCVVTLFKHLAFNDYSPKPFTYAAPPACPGPFAKIVFSADFSVQPGIQFDRTGNVWIGGANIWFGTTAEPSPNLGPSWHVDRDVTEDATLLKTATSGEADVFNIVNSTYNSIIFGTAKLEFYPASKNEPAAATPDGVYPLAAGATGETVALNTPTDLLKGTFTFPANVERAYLDVYAQSQHNDEFWYTCVPNDLSSALSSCPGTGFRETEVQVDGQPAGVAPVYPWIFTGGIDPYLWFPMPGVQTLNFQPYRVDLTPFAGMLDDGKPHTVSLSVFNADDYFSATATLFTFLDKKATQVTGAVVRNTLAAAPSEDVVENIAQHPKKISGTVDVGSARSFEIEGYVKTSHGKISTHVEQHLSFANDQRFLINSSVYEQRIDQSTEIASRVKTTDGRVHFTSDSITSWPLSVDIVQKTVSSGFTLTTKIRQAYHQRQEDATDGALTYRSVTSNTVAPVDTLLINSAGQLTGNTGQSSLQQYVTFDTHGHCYSKTITAANNAVTSISDAPGCAP